MCRFGKGNSAHLCQATYDTEQDGKKCHKPHLSCKPEEVIVQDSRGEDVNPFLRAVKLIYNHCSFFADVNANLDSASDQILAFIHLLLFPYYPLIMSRLTRIAGVHYIDLLPIERT